MIFQKFILNPDIVMQQEDFLIIPKQLNTGNKSNLFILVIAVKGSKILPLHQALEQKRKK